MTQHSRTEAEADADTDAAVIRLSRHEPEQFTVVFRRHAPYIQRYVVRRLGPDAADDIVAETFLAAFRQRDSYDFTRADARPWLYGIATNIIGRHRLAETRQYRAVARSGALSAELRDTLLLVTWGDLSYEEAATALGVPVGTVRSRVSRARGKLRRALGDTNPAAFQEESEP
jgi:DNA-directed RNA polymerase specialized sigma24 family protein